MNGRTLAKQLLPPILHDAVLRGRQRLAKPQEGGALRRAGWYDEVYRTSRTYREHYTESHYYFMWAVVADRLAARGHEGILDLGAGPGQFAELLRDRGISKYRGVDFSAESVRLARERCPEFSFVVADLEGDPAQEFGEFDTAIALEFLEHVSDDLAILGRLVVGTYVLFSVPSFDAPSHVRYFHEASDVLERYAPLFSDLKVDTLIANREGTRFFLGGGTRS